MPLDTSATYPLTRLRLDGRRWNELRLLQAQISTNPASSGSSYLSMGNTAVLCTVHGPAEGRRSDSGGQGDGAIVEVDVNIAGFAGIDRKKKAAGGGGGGDRQSTNLSNDLRIAFQEHILAYLYPHSTITIHISVLSSDGSLLAACLNAGTLALIDAGIPMPGLLCGCTAGMSGVATAPYDTRASVNNETSDTLDPLLDLASPEELELPFITVGTTTSSVEDDEEEADEMKVSVLDIDSNLHDSYAETMLAVAIDGCKQVREIMEGVIRDAGRRILAGEVEAV